MGRKKKKPDMKGDILVMQDCNLLFLPPWFLAMLRDQHGHYRKLETRYGISEVRTGAKPPEMLDQTILLYLIHRTSNNHWNSEIVTTPYEVLSACDMSLKNRFYTDRLKDSLYRWSHVKMTFNGTFYNGKAHLDATFGFVDSFKYEPVPRGNRIRILLDREWLDLLRRTEYYRPISFEFFKALRVPVGGRLYEILLRANSPFKIGTLKLGEWMGITPKKLRTGKRQMMESDVLRAIEKGVQDINRVVESQMLDKGIRYSRVFRVSYETQEPETEDGKQNIVFTKHTVDTAASVLPEVDPVQAADEFLSLAYGGEYCMNDDNTPTNEEKLALHFQLQDNPVDEYGDVVGVPNLEVWIATYRRRKSKETTCCEV